MRDLLDKVNATFDNSINSSSEDVALQLKIVKNNINRLFEESMGAQQSPVEPMAPVTQSIPEMPALQPAPAVVEAPVEQPTEPVVAVNPLKKNVFIVDDSVIIRNYLQKLCSEKYAVTSLNSGQECINKLGSMKPDLLLLDLMMPGIDGFGVLDYIKSNGIFVPTIIISGDTTKESIDKAFEYNVVDMIEKPFSEKTIMDKIDRILN